MAIRKEEKSQDTGKDKSILSRPEQVTSDTLNESWCSSTECGGMNISQFSQSTYNSRPAQQRNVNIDVTRNAQGLPPLQKDALEEESEELIIVDDISSSPRGSC